MDNKTDKNKLTLCLKNVLTFLQIMSIIIAGAWTIILFIKFDHAEKQTHLKLQKNQVILDSLSSKLAILDIEKTKLNYDKLKSHIYKVTDEYAIKKIKKKNSESFYDLIEYKYEIFNIGTVKLEVTYAIINVYGLRFSDLNLGKEKIKSLPDIITDESEWKYLTSKGHYYDVTNKKNRTYEVDKKRRSFIKGGGGTSEMDSGESSTGSIKLIINSDEYDMIGIELRIGINKGKTSDNRWKSITYILLNEMELE